LSRTTADSQGHLLGGEQSAGDHIGQIDTQLSVVRLNPVNQQPVKRKKMRTYISSKSLKRAAATLVLAVSVVSAGFGLTGCGSHGGGGMDGGGGGISQR
jgi:hypothetical protein